ncbi:MAG: hypothetical protein IV090_13490 [Candidatus Sericytochromatia bacterium]|nr:hypothetical protein [Candidatus Sericytochromatia bacterium]
MLKARLLVCLSLCLTPYLSLSGCQGSAVLSAQGLPPASGHSPALAQTQLLNANSTRSAFRFPEDWQGVWRGNCSNTGPGGKQTYAPVQMNLTILPQTNQRWQWKIEYISGEKQVRDYLLKPVDAAKGHWLIDENNGILLDNFSINGGLILEAFTVGPTLIHGRHQRLDGNLLKVELTSYSLQGDRKSGAEPYPVSSLKLMSLQDCDLKRSTS